MDCLRKLTVRKKNGSYVAVPCGCCLACRIKKRDEWVHRLECESSGRPSLFVTLTYSDQFMIEPSLNYKHLQTYIASLRHAFKCSGRPKFRYYAVGEYGDKNFRRHFHILLIGADMSCSNILSALWPCGRVDVRPSCPERVKYCLKYITKFSTPRFKEFCKSSSIASPRALMSKGIGKDWLFKHLDYLIEHPYYYRKGRKYPLPKYYTSFLDSFVSFAEIYRFNSMYAKKNCLRSPVAGSFVRSFNQLKGEIASGRAHGVPSDDLSEYEKRLYQYYRQNSSSLGSGFSVSSICDSLL